MYSVWAYKSLKRRNDTSFIMWKSINFFPSIPQLLLMVNALVEYEVLNTRAAAYVQAMKVRLFREFSDHRRRRRKRIICWNVTQMLITPGWNEDLSLAVMAHFLLSRLWKILINIGVYFCNSIAVVLTAGLVSMLWKLFAERVLLPFIA